MSWMDQIGNMLQQYSGGTAPAPAVVHQEFDTVARNAPKPALASGISEMFRSPETPPFGQMVGQLFGNSDGQQKAGLLNRLLSALGPGFASQVGGVGGLGGLLGRGTPVTPQEAEALPPAAVQQMAEHAEQHDPTVVDKIGSFYAEHPTLVKTVGVGALLVAMSKMTQR